MISALQQDDVDHLEIQAKINKAAMLAFTNRVILRQENQELHDYEQTVGEARKAVETPKRRMTTRRKAKQPQRSPTPSDSENDLDSPYNTSDDDMDASIIVVVQQ
ncbi:MAG: hypothetical protein M1840_004391 [Geoglossum simile]|nr:MAG: hypothetical protein M1840_004391 [Geoglossum simile]